MNELFSAQRWAAIGDAVYQWLSLNVFVLGNAVQLLVVALSFGVALLAARRVTPRLEAFALQRNLTVLLEAVRPLVLPAIWLLLLSFAIIAATAADWPSHVLTIASSLLTAWVAIRLVSQLVRNPVWSKVIAWAVWSIAALNILNLLIPTIGMLDALAVNLGPNFTISLYTVLKATLALVVLMWLAIYLTGLLETRIRTSRALSPSVQVLFVKSLKAVLIGFAVVIAITSLGFDLTALAVVGTALGLGAGFGLQRVISNIVSGVVLLLDKSIRPGDVISVAGTYGWVTALGGRYVSVVTRDGVEHLIPNELLITERVENWTHTSSQTRLKISVPVHYDTDLPLAMGLCVEAARETERVLEQPDPKCLLIGFGDRALDLEVRIWIGDAHNGVQNVKSEVLLKSWQKFRAHGIKVPYPQREVHVAAEPLPAAALPTPRSARG
jgi:small-conductance mechanosensitive channel